LKIGSRFTHEIPVGRLSVAASLPSRKPDRCIQMKREGASPPLSHVAGLLPPLRLVTSPRLPGLLIAVCVSQVFHCVLELTKGTTGGPSCQSPTGFNANRRAPPPNTTQGTIPAPHPLSPGRAGAPVPIGDRRGNFSVSPRHRMSREAHIDARHFRILEPSAETPFRADAFRHQSGCYPSRTW